MFKAFLNYERIQVWISLQFLGKVGLKSDHNTFLLRSMNKDYNLNKRENALNL